MNYYNENDPKAAAWLRELIRDCVIPNGTVDIRGIAEVRPVELMGYRQCHFFAGIGGWAYAIELAQWPDPIWTGSCPCQPFSNAGKQLGTGDVRHLWPMFRDLIGECRPPVVFGEQVASKLGRDWLAGVFTDLERMGYAGAGADLCAAGVGSPQVRQRLYWVGVDQPSCQRGPARVSGPEPRQEGHTGIPNDSGDKARARERERERERRTIRLVHAEQPGLEGQSGHEHDRNQSRWVVTEPGGPAPASGPACFWSPADLLACTDGRSRRVEPGTFPLAHGISGRVGLLRGYGNAIVPQLAAAFIRAVKETGLTPSP